VSKICVIPIDFLGQGALLEPADRKLHDMAVEYCARELQDGKDLNLAKFNKVWVAVAMEGEEYKEILGITGFVWRIDLPVFRVSGDRADRTTHLLAERLHSYFQDQGARGTELFIHISSFEKPEQKCDKWEESLAIQGAKLADRFLVRI
jgi:hypothetical protein